MTNEPEVNNTPQLENQSVFAVGIAKENKQKPRGRKSDLLFEMVCKVCGINLSGMTRDERGRVNKAVKQLKEVKATPADVKTRAENYVAKYGLDITLSPQALTGNWSQLENRREQQEMKAYAGVTM